MSVDRAETFTKNLLRPIGDEEVKELGQRVLRLPTTGSKRMPKKIPNRQGVYSQEIRTTIGRMDSPIRRMDIVFADLAALGAAFTDLLPSKPTEAPPLIGELAGRTNIVVIGDREVDVSLLPDEYRPQPAPSQQTKSIIPAGEILAAVRDQAAKGRHDIRSVASFEGVKFLTNTKLLPPFKDEFTWCPTMSTKIEDELYLYHKFETALMLAGPKVYTYPEVEQLREKMIREGRLNIPNKANPEVGKLILIVEGRFQAIEIDFGLSQIGFNELSRKVTGRLNNHGRAGLPNYIHIKSAHPGRSEWFSLDEDVGGSLKDRIIEYWKNQATIINALCSPRVSPEIIFNVSSGRIPDPRLAVLNGVRHTF